MRLLFECCSDASESQTELDPIGVGLAGRDEVLS